MNDKPNDGRKGRCGDPSVGDCREALERLDDFLDKELTAEEIVSLEHHLKLCDHCTEEYGLRSAAQEVLRRKLCCEHCPDALRAAIAARLRAEGC